MSEYTTLPKETSEAEQMPQTPPKYISHRKCLILLSVMVFASLCVLGISSLSGKKLHKSPLQRQQLIAPSPTEVSQQPTTIPPHWELRKQSSSGEQLIASFSEDYRPFVDYENNFIFYKDNDQQIKGYDIQSGIASPLLPQNFYDSLKQGYSINSMQVYGDTLFFSAGAWSVGGNEYWESLTSTASPQLITNLSGYEGHVVSKNNHDFLIDFWSGDVCGSGAIYYIFNPTNKTVGQKIAQVSYGCINGYNDKGIDEENRLLLPYYDDVGPLATIPGAGPNNLLIYTRIDAYSFATSQIISLVTPTQMPPNITSIVYDAANDRLLLIGQSLYSLQLKSLTLKKEMDLPTDWSTQVSFSDVTPDSTCILEVDKKSQMYKYFTINLVSQRIASVKVCPTGNSTAVFDDEILPSSITLPTGYTLTNIIKN